MTPRPKGMLAHRHRQLAHLAFRKELTLAAAATHPRLRDLASARLIRA